MRRRKTTRPRPKVLRAALWLVLGGCSQAVVGEWTLARYWVDGEPIDLDTWEMGEFEYVGTRLEVDLTVKPDLDGTLAVDVCYSDICESYTMDVTCSRAEIGGEVVYLLDATSDEDGRPALDLTCVPEADLLTCDGTWGDEDVTMEFAPR